MRFLYMLACAFALGSLPLQAASAQSAPWRVTAQEGAVRVTQPGLSPVQARANESLRPGAVVTTGANSRATLENGLQRVVMSANSRMTIAADSTDAMTRILQDLGSLFFQIDRRDAQHFSVETPLLAAVVKGTSFTVSVTPQQDVVHVSHGLVEVRAHQGGVGNDVAAGATARVQREIPAAVSVVVPSDSGVAAIGASLPVMDYAVTSGGVVEAPGGARAQDGLRLGANANGLGSAAAGGANAHAALAQGGAPGSDGAGGLALGHSLAHNDHARGAQGGGGQQANLGNGNGNGQGGQLVGPGNGNSNGQGGPPATPGNGNGQQGGPPATPGNGNGQGGPQGGGPPNPPPGRP